MAQVPVSSSIQRSVEEFEGWSEIDKELYCPSCSVGTTAEQRIVFHTLPNIFILHLLRFGDDETRSTHTNDSVIVNGCTYDLYSIILHKQLTEEFAHYVAHIKHPDGWYRFDDRQVSADSPARCISLIVHCAFS